MAKGAHCLPGMNLEKCIAAYYKRAWEEVVVVVNFRYQVAGDGEDVDGVGSMSRCGSGGTGGGAIAA